LFPVGGDSRLPTRKISAKCARDGRLMMSAGKTTPTGKTMPARVPRKGTTSGPVTEYCAFWKVKPGLGKVTVDRIAKGLGRRFGTAREMYSNIGVHDTLSKEAEARFPKAKPDL
jgi:hypothetical protein